MEKLSVSEIREKVLKHTLWLQGDELEGVQADFSGRLIRFSDLHQASLCRSIFRGSRLKAVEFVDADLSAANFEGATLVNVDFHNAILDGANFSGATFKNVHIVEADLKKLEGQLRSEQVEGITASYGRFMFMIFFTWA